MVKNHDHKQRPYYYMNPHRRKAATISDLKL